MRKVLAALLLYPLLLACCSYPLHAANTHAPDILGEVRAIMGDGFQPYVVPTTCTPAVPSSSLSFAAFACTGYVRGALSDLVYISQPARVVGPLSAGNGTYWLALHRDTTTVVGGWTRQAGTAYLWQKATTQPVNPAGGLVFLQVTVAGGVITARTMVAPTTMTRQDCLNVQDFGANPDDAVDDTAAFLAAIAAVPGTVSGGASYTDKGARCIIIPLPLTDMGAYRISSNLNFHEKWNVRMFAPAAGAFSRNTAPYKALIRWTGGTNGRVFLLDVSLGNTFENISIDCGGTAGVVGFALGADGSGTSNVNANTFRNPVVRNCDIGMRLGDLPNAGPNIANNNIYNPVMENNVSGGIIQRSGNGVNNIFGAYHAGNGSAPLAPHAGANIEVEGGQLVIDGYISGGGITGVPKPQTADIYVGAGAVTIKGQCWSDTHGIFLKGEGGNTQASSIDGCRHLEGTMTDAIDDTPTSILWTSVHPLILIGGLYFGNIEVNTGNSSHVIPIGTRFHYGSPHTTATPNYTGTVVSGSQLGIAGFFGAGVTAYPVVSVGRPPRDDAGQGNFQVWNTDRQPYIVVSDILAASPGVGTAGYQAAGAGWNWFGNGHYDSASNTIKSNAVGPMTWLRVQGGTTTNTVTLSFYTDTAASANQTRFAGTETKVFEFNYEVNGVPPGPSAAPEVGLTMSGRTIMWGTGPPSQGTWGRGSITWNSVATVGQPIGWMCKAAPCTGAADWAALAIL